MYIKILVVILSVLLLSPVYAVDINYDAIVVLKDIGTSTPDGDTEKPRTIDDAIRRNARLLEIAYHEKLLTANGTVTTADTYIIGSSSTAILVSFPSASSCANGTTTKVFVVKNIGAGTMTLSPTIDSVGSPTVSQNQAMTIFTDGTRWMEVRAKNSASSTRATDADNADLLNSQAGSYYRDASNLNTGEIPLARLPGTLTGKDADTLDGQHGSYYRDAANLNANTVPLAQIPTTLTGKDADTLDTIDSTGFVLVDTTYIKSWRADTVLGTGTMNLVAGPGISISGTVTSGVGTVTITGVGTTTAGGWLDTGTQSVLTSGYQVNLNSGTIVGITDAQIPNTITLDNITQITTRNFSDLQGTPTVAQLGNISLGTQTNGLLSLGTQTNGVLSVSALNSGIAIKTQMTGTNTLKSLGTIPDDDTPPLISEGTEVLSLSYSAVNANDWIFVEAVANVSVGGSDVAAGIGAIFQGGTSTAIASNRFRSGADSGTNKDMIIPVTGIPFRAGTTTSQTFYLRCGSPSGTPRSNACATDGLARMGGTMYTTLKITEYTP